MFNMCNERNIDYFDGASKALFYLVGEVLVDSLGLFDQHDVGSAVHLSLYVSLFAIT